MLIILPVLLIVSLSIAGLALGVVMGRSPLRGTCDAQSCSRVVKCYGCRLLKSQDASR